MLVQHDTDYYKWKKNMKMIQLKVGVTRTRLHKLSRSLLEFLALNSLQSTGGTKEDDGDVFQMSSELPEKSWWKETHNSIAIQME